MCEPVPNHPSGKDQRARVQVRERRRGMLSEGKHGTTKIGKGRNAVLPVAIPGFAKVQKEVEPPAGQPPMAERLRTVQAQNSGCVRTGARLRNAKQNNDWRTRAMYMVATSMNATGRCAIVGRQPKAKTQMNHRVRSGTKGLGCFCFSVLIINRFPTSNASTRLLL